MKYLPSAAFALVAIAIPAHAEIFRCTAPGGTVTYQEIPCPASAPGRATDIPVAYPEINRAERERLLQREQALAAGPAFVVVRPFRAPRVHPRPNRPFQPL